MSLKVIICVAFMVALLLLLSPRIDNSNTEQDLPPSPSIQTNDTAETDSCWINASVVHDWNITQHLIADQWEACYQQPYSDATSTETLVSNCHANDNVYLFVGAIAPNTTDLVSIGAYGPGKILTQFTNSTTTAYKIESWSNVYWYNVNLKSFGFSSDPIIHLLDADLVYYENGTTENPRQTDRLSWHNNGVNGGWRAGSTILGNKDNNWQKVVYYKYCTYPTLSN
eukprot:33527_1